MERRAEGMSVQTLAANKGYTATGASFDPGGRYRYLLWRSWDPSRPRVAFIMLNPSTADAMRDDPTIRRCLGFARSWGFGSLEVANLFAYRATHPSLLSAVADPVGPENDRYLLGVGQRGQLVVAAWGNVGSLMNRAQTVSGLLTCLLYCLGTTTRGQPRHPLYLRRHAIPGLWQGTDCAPFSARSEPSPCGS